MPVSVRLDKEKCKGCTTCIKHCPTEAIRVRFGHAKILEDRCIDCGQCVRVCPQHAKKPVADSLDRIKDYKYSVVLPAPSLYAQFRNLSEPDIVLAALLKLGFNAVFEPAAAAEMISDLTRRELEEGAFDKPLISSACPAVTRLIRQRFPNMLPHVSRHVAPAELAAKLAREKAERETGLGGRDIGIFFITPCPAKVTEAHNPLGLSEPVIDHALPMNEIYLKLLPLMKRVSNPPPLQTAGRVGIEWATAGGESEPVKNYNVISCDGLDNVIRLLEDAEDGKLPAADYMELNACTMGCVGGCLAVENPFVARARLKKLKTRGEVGSYELNTNAVDRVWRTKRILHAPSAILDADFGKAMEKLRKIEALKERLPGLDCGSCGTPGCAAFAQDVVLGFAEESDCIFNMRTRMREDGAIGGDAYLPPPFRRLKTEKEDEE